MLGLTEILLLSVSFSFIILNKMIYHNPEPIFNVYQRPNGFYWFKVIIMYFVLHFKQLIHKLIMVFKEEKEIAKYFKELEKPQKLSDHDQPIDAVYFNAANKNGDHLVMGTARRKNGLVDAFLYVKINDDKIGLLESIKVPDTACYQEKEKEEFEAEGFKAQCLEPMKKWKITYQGKMKKNSDPNQCFDVALDVMYTSVLPYFNFDTDMDPFALAKCIALEKWSREYFQLLNQDHQTHYEQHGNIAGHIIINGETHLLNMESMRDHSFGHHREWRNLHKYNLHIFTLENGDRFTIGNICSPLTFSSIEMGFVYSDADKKLYPITYNDFQLYQHGESGTPPLDYAFTIQAGGKTYTIKVDVIDSPYFFISKDWECKVIERLCTFNVNGLKGWGASEWQHRNMLGRGIQDSKKVTISEQSLIVPTSAVSTKISPVRRLVGVEPAELFEKMLRQ